MAEATPQKRVLPARERSNSTAKRRASSPIIPATPTSTEPRQKRKYTKRGTLNRPSITGTGTPSSSTPADEALPMRIQASKPLPTSTEKQADQLSNREYQSIAESAVLAASLYRSRMQWLCEGVFKWYWTKPVKRKGVVEQPPGNPDAKSMSKLGNATMMVEPHVFDVTFYTVKDPSVVVAPPPQYYRHPNQHTVKQSPSGTPNLFSAPMVQQQTQSTLNTGPVPTPQPKTSVPGIPGSPATPAAPAAPATSATQAVPNAPTGSTTPAEKQIKQEEPALLSRTNAPSSSGPTTPMPPHPVAHLPTQSVAPAPSRPANDPVIQMLAARAATDNRLKELMKVVAMSQATTEQLREFQAHIDEFNKIIKQQEAKKAESEKQKPNAPPAAAHPATYNATPRSHPGPPTSIGGPMHMVPTAYSPYPPPPPPKPEPFIRHIVVEFHSAATVSQGASTDRWLFPEYAVLDIKPSGMEMTASFLVVQKGEDILRRQNVDEAGSNNLSYKFKPDIEYYQPVTVQIKATQHKTIETIARAAKSLAECQEYMKKVMQEKTRAPQEYLVHRLPRDKVLAEPTGRDFVDSAVELSNDEDDELKDVYGM